MSSSKPEWNPYSSTPLILVKKTSQSASTVASWPASSTISSSSNRGVRGSSCTSANTNRYELRHVSANQGSMRQGSPSVVTTRKALYEDPGWSDFIGVGQILCKAVECVCQPCVLFTVIRPFDG